MRTSNIIRSGRWSPVFVPRFRCRGTAGVSPLAKVFRMMRARATPPWRASNNPNFPIRWQNSGGTDNSSPLARPVYPKARRIAKKLTSIPIRIAIVNTRTDYTSAAASGSGLDAEESGQTGSFWLCPFFSNDSREGRIIWAFLA